ncbi:MAG: hypothetical protein NT150_13365 [Bacteroidetes bacterium]|nr:hypothetical protein [Bacteroidota bacterium]
MKNKIETKEREIADSDALKYKDFDGVLKKASILKASSRVNFKWVGGIAGVILASTAAVIYFSGSDGIFAARKEKIVTIAMITPDAEKITASNNSVIETKNGSLIVIDENSFVDQNGQVIKSGVELSFKEYHDPLEQIISGIPMTYDSAGTQYHFESAGMFEINAVDANVKINPHAPLRVILNSKKNGTDYNLYEYNKEKKNWEFLARDKTPANFSKEKMLKKLHIEFSGKMSSTKDQVASLKSVQANIDKEKPILPKEENKENYRVSIDVDPVEMPELATFKNLKFEVLPNSNFDPRKANLVWEYAAVKKEKEKYIITFYKGGTTYAVEGVPVYSGKNYSDEKRKFDFGISAYNRRMDSITLALSEKTKILEAAKKKVEDIIAIQVKEKPLIAEDEEVGGMEHEVLRAFTVSKFGTYNCDCPKTLPTEQIVNAHFKSKEGNLSLTQVYLVERNNKKMYTIYDSFFKTFPFNPKNSNLIISVDSIGQIRYFDNFGSIGSGDDKVDFAMTPLTIADPSAVGIKKFFNF